MFPDLTRLSSSQVTGDLGTLPSVCLQPPSRSFCTRGIGLAMGKASQRGSFFFRK